MSKKITFVTLSLRVGGAGANKSKRAKANAKYFKVVNQVAQELGMELRLVRAGDFNDQKLNYRQSRVISDIKNLHNLPPEAEGRLKILNPRVLKEVCLNKRETHSALVGNLNTNELLIPELELKSDSSPNDLFNFIKQNPSEFYILKPKSGQQAIGIEKVDRNELLKNVEVYLSAKYTGKYLLQNFVESSTMYRCFVYSVNGLSQSNSAYIRVPKNQDTKLMDGTKRDFEGFVPERVKLFAKEVCQTLTEHCGLKESFIAVDFLEDPKGRIWLLEVNSNPGFIPEYEDKALARGYAEALLRPAKALFERNFTDPNPG